MEPIFLEQHDIVNPRGKDLSGYYDGSTTIVGDLGVRIVTKEFVDIGINVLAHISDAVIQRAAHPYPTRSPDDPITNDPEQVYLFRGSVTTITNMEDGYKRPKSIDLFAGMPDWPCELRTGPLLYGFAHDGNPSIEGAQASLLDLVLGISADEDVIRERLFAIRDGIAIREYESRDRASEAIDESFRRGEQARR